MVQLIRNGFLFFAYETGIIVELWRYEALGLWALVAVGTAMCCLGICIYRKCSAALLFMLVATVSCMLLRDHTSWRAVVTCFSVIGVTVGFLALFWNRLDACAFCTLLGGCAGWALLRSLWGVIPLALLGLVFALTFPVEALRTLTAVFGGWVLWELAVWQGRELSWLFILPAAALGYLVQGIFSRRQTLFKKVRPDRLTHWLEERERKLQHAHSVSKRD